MATYTWEELKDYTSVPAVSGFSEAKCMLYQTMAEAFLDSLSLDSAITGYANAYNSAVIIVFDMLAENPTCLQSFTQGKVSKDFVYDGLPSILRILLKKYISGANGNISGAPFSRMDIGLR